MLLRPLGNVVHSMPSFCITEDELDRIVDVAVSGIERALA
jgi:adenosylmethionine-8-amino-7-oxononanoate aminotransferase